MGWRSSAPEDLGGLEETGQELVRSLETEKPVSERYLSARERLYLTPRKDRLSIRGVGERVRHRAGVT